MEHFALRSFTAGDIPALMALQQRYAAAYPGAGVFAGEAYLGPRFHGGDDVACCVDTQGKLLGYAVVFAYAAEGDVSQPYTIWAEVRADPPLADPAAIKDALFERVIQRANTLASSAPGRLVHLSFQYYPAETPSIAFVTGKGCVHSENIYQMARDLAQPVAVSAPPPGITVQPWRMASEVEQQRYLRARNAAFPTISKSLPEWQYFMRSSLWAVGTSITAFAGEDPRSADVVGSVLVYWDEAEQVEAERKVGYTEAIFVAPSWRRRGVARALVSTALAHLREHRLDEARLEVRARNANALRLYQDLGYQVAQQSGIYTLKLSP